MNYSKSKNKKKNKDKAAYKDKDKLSGVIATYKKRTQASTSAIALHLIKNTFADAIEYKGTMEGARGMLLFVGVFALCCVGSANFILLDGLLTRFSWFDFIVSSIALSIGNIVTFFVFLQCLRGELFRPIDEPTIFDRKHRKVYRIFSDVQEGWMGLLKSWPLKVGIYDWDLVKAEHHVAIHATGSTLMRHHALVFSIRKSTHDNTIVNGFMLGNSIHHGELTVPAVYEHVRRFMEEDGPHLPAGGKATSIDTPRSFFQCMARSGPYGQSFHKWWGNARLLTVLWILFSQLHFRYLR